MFTNNLKSSILLCVASDGENNKKTLKKMLTINIETCYYFEVASREEVTNINTKK